MKTKFKKNGRRLLAAILCLVMAVMALPMSAFAWTSEEGVSCTSSFGDYYVGSDGEYYRSKSSYSFIVYDSDGNTSVRTISAGNAKRKYGAYCTGITQNVDDLLQSHTARTMLANSEFIIMLNQASTDRIELAKLLNISDLQLSYITNVGAGQGLLKVGSSLVPFVNKFPRNTELYKLMTTKFGEV